MNNKGKGNPKTYVAVLIVLAMALVFVIYMLGTTKTENKVNPIEKETVKTTTGKVDYTVNDTSIDISNETDEDESKELEITNFSVTLNRILNNMDLVGDYKIKILYNGVRFNFNCVTFDANSGTCLEGSALMNLNNVLIPLFTYSNDTENFFNRPTNYYIIVNDTNIILANSIMGQAPGNIKIYDRAGKYLNTINDVILGFRYEGEFNSSIYPSVEENTLYFNTCKDNKVISNKVDLNVPTNVIQPGVLQNTTCY